MDDSDEGDFINVDRAYLGKAGENLTAGMLLLNGFNVFTGEIDQGIDLVASKDDAYYKIQVKTCQDIEGYDSGRYMARINLTTLARHDPSTTFVVFVIHYLSTNVSLDLAGRHSFYDQAYIVLPVEKIFKFTQLATGNVVLQLRSSLVTDQYGSGFMFKMIYNRRELILDEYLIESFSQIVKDVEG